MVRSTLGTRGDGRLTIVFAADGNFSTVLGMSVESILRNTTPGAVGDFYVLDDGVEDWAKAKIETLKRQYDFDIKYINVSERVENCASSCQYPRVTFARFLVDEMLPASVHGRVFYTDADVLFPGDLAPLLEWDMQDMAVAAVQAVRLASGEGVDYLKQWRSFFHIGRDDDSGTYHHASPMLFDIDRWREWGVSRTMLEMGQSSEYRALPMLDQDIFNAVCWGKIATLPVTYCVIPLFQRVYNPEDYAACFQNRLRYPERELREAWQNPVSIHYAGVKPHIMAAPANELEAYHWDFWAGSRWRRHVPYTPREWKPGESRLAKGIIQIALCCGAGAGGARWIARQVGLRLLPLKRKLRGLAPRKGRGKPA